MVLIGAPSQPLHRGLRRAVLLDLGCRALTLLTSLATCPVRQRSVDRKSVANGVSELASNLSEWVRVGEVLRRTSTARTVVAHGTVLGQSATLPIGNNRTQSDSNRLTKRNPAPTRS